MQNTLIYTAGSAPASKYAASVLVKYGAACIDHPSPDVTHLLLDVPSFSGTLLRNGRSAESLLETLPEAVKIIGGKLDHPLLRTYRCSDLLEDPFYAARNAAITARCAIRVAVEKLDSTLYNLPVLIIGWGRIGKCLGQLLSCLGAQVFIFARNEKDRALISALGFHPVDSVLPEIDFRILFNTVPAVVFPESQFSQMHRCIKIDLASLPGLTGSDVISARGLPGRMAPESSGELIAHTVLRIIKEGQI